MDSRKKKPLNRLKLSAIHGRPWNLVNREMFSSKVVNILAVGVQGVVKEVVEDVMAVLEGAEVREWR